MKFFIAIALIAAVASASIIKPTIVAGELAEIQEIIAAINSPSTDPATAAALEQMLLDIMGVALSPEPVSVGPAIVDSYEPISVGPAIIESNPISIGPEIIDFPLPDGGAASAPVDVSPVIVAPSPVVVGPTPAAESSPLVQIILNINQPANSPASPVVPAPVIVPEVDQPQPIIVVDQAVEPVIVVDQAVEPVIVVDQAPEPVIVVDTPTVVEPVQVVEVAPVVPEAVIIGTPIIPAPAVVLPEILN